MSHPNSNSSPFVRAIIVLGLLAGLGFTTWLLATPALNASSQLAPLTFTSPIGNPQFSLQKSVDNSAPAPGDQINYTLSYSNTRPGSQAFNVRLYDFLPAGAQFISSNPPATPYPNGVLLFTAPSVGPGTQTITASVRIRVPDRTAQIANHALVTADGVTPTAASLVTNITGAATNWLRLTKTGPSAVLADRPLVYTVRATNVGNAALYDVTVIDALPTGVTLGSSTPAPSAVLAERPLVYTLRATNVGSATLYDVTVIDALPTSVMLGSSTPAPSAVTLPTVRWSLGTLNPAETKTIVITTTAPAATGIITNSAIGSAWQNVMTQTQRSTIVVTPATILQVMKTGSASVVRVGETLVYTLDYENTGNIGATTVRLTDTLPSGVTVVGTSQPPVIQTAQQLVWDIGTLDPNQKGQIVVTTTVGGPWDRTLLNTVDITGQAGSYSGYAELTTTVSLFQISLPLIMKN